MNTQTTTKSVAIGSKSVKTAAQAMTLIAYGDSNGLPFRCLDMKCQCEDYADLAACIRIIRTYNEFSGAAILNAATDVLDLKLFYNEGNPNNGNSFFKFDIAREGSPAFYVKMSTGPYSPRFIDDGTVRYTEDDFRKSMAAFAKECKADEFDIEDENGVYLVARFWFD
jgi:hypothetical protein